MGPIEQALKETTSVTQAPRAVGVTDYARATTRMTAMRSTATQALHLDLQEGDPVLRTTAVNVDVEGVPVEFGRAWFAGDRVTLTLDS